MGTTKLERLAHVGSLPHTCMPVQEQFDYGMVSSIIIIMIAICADCAPPMTCVAPQVCRCPEGYVGGSCEERKSVSMGYY